MANSVAGIFGQTVFTGDQSTELKRRDAVQGFSQVFATILARQMHQSSLGPDAGPMGIQGGTSGDIYGAFFDDAMGKLLAQSPAMKALNTSLEHELARHDGTPGPASLIERVDRPIAAAQLHAETRDETAWTLGGDIASAVLSQVDTVAAAMADRRGPILLPPVPSSLAPDLPPPSLLKGKV